MEHGKCVYISENDIHPSRYLLQWTDENRTYRILGFICLTGNGLAILLLGKRVPRSIQKKKFSDIIQLEILKDVNYDIWCLIACLQVMGYYLPYFYLPCELRQCIFAWSIASIYLLCAQHMRLGSVCQRLMEVRWFQSHRQPTLLEGYLQGKHSNRDELCTIV